MRATRQPVARPAAALIVTLLHAFALWLLYVQPAPSLRRSARFESAPVRVLPPARRSIPSVPSIPRRRLAGLLPPGARSPGAPFLLSSPAAPKLSPPSPEPSAVDWDAELQRSARALTNPTRPDRIAPMARSLPPLPAEIERRAEEFGWDPKVIHRVEETAGGGLLVHLNEHCVLVLAPLPFIGCGIGHKPPNGALFKDMRRESR